jgi:hypothetical protein
MRSRRHRVHRARTTGRGAHNAAGSGRTSPQPSTASGQIDRKHQVHSLGEQPATSAATSAALCRIRLYRGQERRLRRRHTRPAGGASGAVLGRAVNNWSRRELSSALTGLGRSPDLLSVPVLVRHVPPLSDDRAPKLPWPRGRKRSQHIAWQMMRHKDVTIRMPHVACPANLPERFKHLEGRGTVQPH